MWFLLLFIVLSHLYVSHGLDFSTEKMTHYREKVRGMFYHAYDSYLLHAFPLDELKPISCTGMDTWGGFSLTLVDALDTLLVLGNHSEFRRAADVFLQRVDLNADVNVSVFETNIRVIGGLLSAHMLSSRLLDESQLEEGWPCSSRLLSVAERLAQKLLPAFNTDTGMPFGTVNLRYGVHRYETPVTCTAGVGTFLLEFGALSRLTGNPQFERTAMRAVKSLWQRRSSIGLVGNHINVKSGAWTATDAGIGAGVDSYFEYLLKSAVLLQKPELMRQFYVYLGAINEYLRQDDWFFWASMLKGQVTMPVFQSLEAFWPGLLTLVGETDSAMRIMLNYHQVLKQYGFAPEFYNVPNREVVNKRAGYPLRPEMAESLMYLYRATQDPLLLEIGADMVEAIEHSARTKCGYATVHNVVDHTIEDRMESFFLSETTKYLYLLFDPDNFIHNAGDTAKLVSTTSGGLCTVEGGGYVFNTEAHPLDPGIIYCCSAERQRDVGLVRQFEQDLDLVRLVGLDPLHADPFPLDHADLSADVIALTAADDEQEALHVHVDDEGVETAAEDLLNESSRSIDAQLTGDDDDDDAADDERLTDRRAGIAVDAAATPPARAARRQPADASPTTADVRCRSPSLAGSCASFQLQRMFAGSLLQPNSRQKALGQDFAAAVAKAFDSVVKDWRRLADLSEQLAAARRRLSSCHRADADLGSAPLNRLLRLVYARPAAAATATEGVCAPWERPRVEADNYSAVAPPPLPPTERADERNATVERIVLGAFEYRRLERVRNDLLSCAAPSFLSRFSGLGQLVPPPR